MLDLNAARTYCVACSAYAEDLLDEAGDLELDQPPPPAFHRLGNQSDGERPMRGDDV